MPSPDAVGGGGGHKVVTISSEIMVAAVIFFFVAVAFIFFLYIYARWRWGSGSAVRRARLVFGLDQDPTAVPRNGLDLAVVQSLPVYVYKAVDFKDGMECAVCLSELVDGEKARLLPNCNHGFHLDCIDMWFHSHSTCPLCRNPVGPQPDTDVEAGAAPLPEAISTDGYSTELPNFPTNVLFWGTQDQVSTGGGAATRGSEEAPSSSTSPSSIVKSERMLMIDIPRRMVEGISSPFTSEDTKSPTAAAAAVTTPTSTRLRSFRRLLSREKRVVGSSRVASGDDIEQGVVGAAGNLSSPNLPTD